ncbi:hypothetical protein PFISCL1PPCAC_2002, partial [Pristionchus fissidentatus]
MIFILDSSSLLHFFPSSSLPMILLPLLLLLPSSISATISISKAALSFPSCTNLNGTARSSCESEIRSRDELLTKHTDHCCQLHMLPDCTLTCLERAINTNLDKGSRLEIPTKCKKYIVPTASTELRSRRGKRKRCLFESSLAAQKCFVECVNKHLTSSDPEYRYDVERECTYYDIREMDLCLDL